MPVLAFVLEAPVGGGLDGVGAVEGRAGTLLRSPAAAEAVAVLGVLGGGVPGEVAEGEVPAARGEAGLEGVGAVAGRGAEQLPGVPLRPPAVAEAAGEQLDLGGARGVEGVLEGVLLELAEPGGDNPQLLPDAPVALLDAGVLHPPAQVPECAGGGGGGAATGDGVQGGLHPEHDVNLVQVLHFLL